MPLTIVVSGATGRMGRAVARVAADAEDIELGGGIARTGRAQSGRAGSGGTDADAASAYGRVVAVADAAPLIGGADVIVDFSAPAQLFALLEAHADALVGRALVVGTTGLDSDIEARLESLAARAPVLTAANFSIGLNVLLALAADAAARLPADRYDTEIVEAHHRRKADAPSGTALALGRAVADARGTSLDEQRRDGRSGRMGERSRGEIGFHAVRGGGITGEHSVLYLGEREAVELAHRAQDRAVFAEGALEAARWAAGRAPGRYGMRDVLAF